jgi:hypothetical protein
MTGAWDSPGVQAAVREVIEAEREKERHRLSVAVEKAQEAFFASLASSYPEATTGDLSPDYTGDFALACEEVAGAWVELNVPD